MNEVFVVTGGASGIGRAIAELLPRESSIVIADCSKEKLEETESEFRAKGQALFPFEIDISDRRQVHELALFASSLGKVVKVFHCAGVSGSMTCRERIIRINALGTVNVNQEFHDIMQGGVICDIASNSGYVLPRILMPSRRIYLLALKDPEHFVRAMKRRCFLFLPEKWRCQVAYLCSKNFVRWYASGCGFKYMQTKSTRVFSISPGFVKTAMTEKEKGFLSENLLSFVPSGEGSEPEQIACLAVGLADERCVCLVGTDVLCDCGAVSNGYSLWTCLRPYKGKKTRYNW